MARIWTIKINFNASEEKAKKIRKEVADFVHAKYKNNTYVRLEERGR